MIYRRTAAILALLTCTFVLGACGDGAKGTSNANGSGPDQAIENTNVPKTNQEELSLLINVPYETEDITWKEDQADKKITAVMLFLPADANKIVTDAEKIRPSEPVTIRVQNWFPPELIAQSATSGAEDEVRGRAYAADQFYQEPYTSGRIVRVENSDYFIVELMAK